MKKYFISALALIGLTSLASVGHSLSEANISECALSATAYSTRVPAEAEARRAMPIDLSYGRSVAAKPQSSPIVTSDSVMSVMMAPRRVASLSSAADLTGSYVQTSLSLASGAGDSGNATKISLGEDDNTIIIERFWSNLYTPYLKVHAIVDIASATISIPTQQVYTDDTYGPISLVKTNDGSPLRGEPITANIAADGSISLTSPWALYIDSGADKDKYLYANYNTRLRPANATLQFKTYNNPDLVYGYDILVEQTGSNTLSITNFANAGLVTEAILGGDRTMSIPYVPVEYYPFKGVLLSLYPVCDFQYNSAEGSIKYYSFGLNSTPAAADNNTTISWGNWALLAPNVGTLDINSEGSITLKEGEIKYPVDYDANFEGKGTENEPYLIKTVDNLNALASVVNKTKCPAGQTTVLVFPDTYFRLDADLDLQNVPFTAIGAEQYHTFAGVFDGNGHTIKNLKQTNKSQLSYGGLFGVIGGNAVIKNLTVKNVDISTNAYTGVIVGTGHGIIDNCHVVTADIVNNSTATGAIAGIFDGEVKNCTVSDAAIFGLGGYVGGAVGEITAYVNDNALVRSSVKNCYVSNTSIAVWGTNEKGNIGGGVVGNVYWSEVSDCYFSGTVDGSYEVEGKTATNIVGGVAGAVQNSRISNCFAVGNIVVQDYKSYVGGVAGMLGGDMVNCYSSGAVQGANTVFAGGLVGAVYHATIDIATKETAKSTITSSYTSAQVSAYTEGLDSKTQLRELVGSFVVSEGINTLDDMVTITNSYFNTDLTDFGGTRCRSNTALLTDGNLLEGFDSNMWTTVKGMYPRLKGMDGSQAALMSASSIVFAQGSSAYRVRANATLCPQGDTQYYILNDGQLAKTGKYCGINDDTIEIGTANGIDILMVTNGSVVYPIQLSIMGSGLEGLGSEDSPMLIRNKEDIKLLASLVTKENPFHGVHFLMTNDIDLEGDADFIGIAVSRTVDANLLFSGIFDGGGHTIHNMRLNGVTWQDGKSPADDPDGLGTVNTSASIQYQAFIGRLNSDGVLKNINFAADCSDERYSYGAIAVAQCKGLIDNVRNYASVRVYNGTAGSIAAVTETGSTISNCFNSGDVTSGAATAGGIAGTSKGLIKNCANTGNVATAIITKKTVNPGSTVMGNAGGIAGSMGNGTSLLNVLNTGSVYAYTHNAGGICGNWLSKEATVATVSYGTVGTAAEKITTMGGFAGDFGTGASIPSGSSANYFDTQIVGSGSVGIQSVEGITAAETATLTSGEALPGLDTEVWNFNRGMYPVLKIFAEEPSLDAARRIVVTMPTGQTRANLHGTSTLAQAEGMTWTLADGTVFSISGSSLLAPATVETEVNDTLTTAYKGVTKVIPLSAKPACPVEGDGTADNPLIISSAKKWNDLADWMQMMLFNTEGIYVALSADIDFAGSEMKCLSPSDANPWQGTFDGRGHIVKGFDNVTETSYPAIFNTVTNTGVITNVTFQGKLTGKTGGNISVVVGKLYGKVENVTTNVEITTTAALNNIAGIVANAYNGASFTDCHNIGNITSKGVLVAGICVDAAAGVDFTDCSNEGDISTTTATVNTYLAGIVAQSNPNTFLRCHNTGGLTGSNKSNAIAGIVANMRATSGRKYFFTDCYNTGDITGAAFLGGISGTSATTVGQTAIVASNCHNTGNIMSIATANVSSSGSAGLFAVYNAGSDISGCRNSGKVSSSNCQNIGGITGHYKANPNASNPAVILDCVNEGVIASEAPTAGGISGSISGFTTIDGCYNEAPVTALNSVGGIVGASTLVSATVTNCWNSGAVSATGTGVGAYTAAGSGIAAGGIAGRAQGKYIYCYNLGEVKGATYVGGIAGQPTKGTSATACGTQVLNCYNAGALSSTIETGEAGNLIGLAANWNEDYNKADGSFYLSDIYGNKATGTSIGQGLTTAELISSNSATIGEDWQRVTYCLPILEKDVANDKVRLNSICMLTDANGTMTPVTPESIVTNTLVVGNPTGTVWTSPNNITVVDNSVIFNEKLKQEVGLTATLGEYSRTFNFNTDISSGIDGIESDTDPDNGAVYYDLNGLRVNDPVKGRIYIRVIGGQAIKIVR